MSDLFKQMHKKKGKPPVSQPQDDSDDSEEENKEQVAELYKESNFKGPIMPTQSFQPSQSGQPPLPKPKLKPQLSKYSPLPWKDYFDTMDYILDGIPIYTAGGSINPEGPIFVCIHGAGYSALSFAHLAKYVKQFGILVAMDLRGHYQNQQPDPTNLSKDQLVSDIQKIMEVLIEKYTEQSFLIVGHSMGGSIACFAVEQITASSPYKDRIAGLVVIDVVEGTAMEALPFMEQIVQSKPKQFQQVEEAVNYVIRTQEIKNIESARISVPATVKEENNAYVWRVNLMESEQHWKSWFKGLTQSFLSTKIPKILFLAEKDRMDKELTIAQMQGKFKLVILYGVGHVMHEDDPFQTAKALWEFLDCFRIPLNQKEKIWIKTNGIGKFHPDLKQLANKFTK